MGTEPLEWAHRIAERVHVLEKDTPNRLAVRIRQKNPSVVLWDGGLWGRRTAPQVAALLRTGLCADCTALETDGDTLYMTRPAFGGNLLATISCQTRPQMATKRPFLSYRRSGNCRRGSRSFHPICANSRMDKSKGIWVGSLPPVGRPGLGSL